MCNREDGQGLGRFSANLVRKDSGGLYGKIFNQDALEKDINKRTCMLFPGVSFKNLAKAALFQNSPVYVQFYITSRCNLTCQHCNITYANSDVPECSLDTIKSIADNLSKIGVPIVLLTGGEPFARKDLPEIIREFESRGVHVRMQTNGFASREQIQRAIEYGGRDISVSLDTLYPRVQDAINGGFDQSWDKAIRAISLFTELLPAASSFASLGCVLQRDNLQDVEDVIRFGTAIGWFTSLVPVHVSDHRHPMSFRSSDLALQFQPEDYLSVDQLIERIRHMRQEGYLLYDSDQYLDDIERFVQQKPVTWRRKNDGVCDSPALYFAILPNGDFAPCCDHRFSFSVSTASSDFPTTYRKKSFRAEVEKIAGECPGCMFGSFPEMTIALRFTAAKMQRFRIFFSSPPKKAWPIAYGQMLAIAEKIRTEPRARISLPDSKNAAGKMGLDEGKDT